MYVHTLFPFLWQALRVPAPYLLGFLDPPLYYLQGFTPILPPVFLFFGASVCFAPEPGEEGP